MVDFRHIKLIICDMDNTLYDWVGSFVPSFYAMVEQISEITGIGMEDLLDDFRDIHRKYHDTEHPFSALEVASIQRHFAGLDASKIFQELDPALYAFNKIRKEKLKLYPRVSETLAKIQKSSIKLVAHSEGKYYSIIDRIQRFSLDEHFDAIYCRERSKNNLNYISKNSHKLDKDFLNRIFELKHHQRKPSPDVLGEICLASNVKPEDSLYVGDSLSKDILMAHEAGVKSAWARYGREIEPGLYPQLVRISHWSDEEVRFEKELSHRAASVEPDVTLDQGFWQLEAILGL